MKIKEAIKIEKKFKSTFLYILLVPFLLILYNCDLKGLAGDGIDAEEDSGFDLRIFNYSDKEFKGCSFYLGSLDVDGNFIATDSIIYTNLLIYNNIDGPNVRKEDGYSITYPFNYSKKGLNKYGYWEPNRGAIRKISPNLKVYFMVKLHNQTSLTTSDSGLNGIIVLNILENGDLLW